MIVLLPEFRESPFEFIEVGGTLDPEKLLHQARHLAACEPGDDVVAVGEDLTNWCVPTCLLNHLLAGRWCSEVVEEASEIYEFKHALNPAMTLVKGLRPSQMDWFDPLPHVVHSIRDVGVSVPTSSSPEDGILSPLECWDSVLGDHLGLVPDDLPREPQPLIPVGEDLIHIRPRLECNPGLSFLEVHLNRGHAWRLPHGLRK